MIYFIKHTHTMYDDLVDKASEVRRVARDADVGHVAAAAALRTTSEDTMPKSGKTMFQNTFFHWPRRVFFTHRRGGTGQTRFT